MSYESNALNAYRETTVTTASQGSLIVMLYDEAIKQLGFAIELMKDGKIKADKIESVNNHILKAQEIVTELMASLDMNTGGQIAENLLSLYTFFNQQLLQANMKKIPEPLVNVKTMMAELREAWQEIVTKTPPPPNREVGSGINIAG